MGGFWDTYCVGENTYKIWWRNKKEVTTQKTEVYLGG